MNKSEFNTESVILKKEDIQYGQMDIIVSIDAIKISFTHPQMGRLEGTLSTMYKVPASMMEHPRLRTHSGEWLVFSKIDEAGTALFPDITKNDWKEYRKIQDELKTKKEELKNQLYEAQCPGYLELVKLEKEWIDQKSYNDAAAWNQINNQDYSKYADPEKVAVLKAKYEAWKKDHPRAAALLKIKEAIARWKDPRACEAQECLLNGGSIEEAMNLYNQPTTREPYWN